MKKIITPSEMRNYLRSEPVLSNASDALLKKIHSMEPHTAYALLGGHLAPLLYTKQKTSTHFQSLAAPIPAYSPTSIASSTSSASVSFSTISKKGLEGITKVKEKFKEIEDILLDLQKNAKTILQFKDYKEYEKIKELWDHELSKGSLSKGRLERLKSFKGIMGRFSVSKSLILHKLEELDKAIDQLGKFVPQSLIDSLQKTRKNLLQQIPKGNKDIGEWKFPYQRLEDNRWGSREIKRELEGDYRIEDPTGLLEMARDPKKLRDYLANIRSAFNEIAIHTTTGSERAHLILQQLKNDFSNMQKRLKDLYENRQEIIDRWLDSKESNPIKPDNQLLKDFYYLREDLEKDLDQIKGRIEKFEEDMPGSKDKDKLIEQLNKTYEDLESKIPEPNADYSKDSGNWKPRPDALVDRKGEKTRLRFWWKENDWDTAKIMKWDDSGDTALPKNPLGIFEMVIDADRSKYKDFLGTLSKGIDNINEFYKTTGSKALHVFLLQDMDTEAAYMYMIVILLPLLQNQAAEGLEEQGNTMKQVSKLYDKWNEIQSEINNMTKAVKTLKETGLLKDGKLKIDVIEDYWNKESVHYKITAFDDPDRVFQKIFEARDAIDKKIEEAKKLLKSIKGRLPSSSHTLLETMDKLLKNLSVTSRDYSFYYYVKDQVRFEVPATEVTLKDLKDHDTMSKFILDRTKESFGFFVDSDQTKFKAYMDNIAQGITALTSISNMTQQQLQIDTQYYNSLLGFQKSAQDSVNKIIQTTINNMR